MKNVLIFVWIFILITSVAGGEVNPALLSKGIGDGAQSARGNGTLGSLTITAQQVDALQVHVDASVTTQGGDGLPVVVTFGGNTYTLNNQVWLYAQIYDSPWVGGCTSWTSSPGSNWCAGGHEFFLNSPDPLGSFAQSFTATVPEPGDYQTLVMVHAGLTWITTGYDWFSVSQTVLSYPAGTIYIDSTPSGRVFDDDFESGDTSSWSDGLGAMYPYPF